MIGKQLAHYHIVEQIGEGGMGTVFRARDTKLDRDVAIKVLPREMSGDPERIARFQREARTLASLQHQNIASVYGFDEVDGVRFLAMELVEGEDLSSRIERGPMLEPDAVEILRKIAAALDAAHAMSIVHRDLKPANIKLTADGDIKVLDFGLARAYAGDPESQGDPTLSPTITAAMTLAGTILGTAAYMSPEQARGRAVDQRADVWAMGVIFFEMLTGERLYRGETVTDVLAAVITIEPDLERLPDAVSPQSRRVLRRCLQRDPRRRIRAAADAVLEFDDPAVPGAGPPTSAGSTSRVPWLITALVIVAALGLQWMSGVPDTPTAPARQYDVAFSPELRVLDTCVPAISPDGQWVAIAAADSVGWPLTVLRSLATGEVRVLDGDAAGQFFFWSPDSRHLAYSAEGRLEKLHIESMSADRIGGSGEMFSRGGSWSSQNQILFAPNANSALNLVDPEGAHLSVATRLDSTLVDGSHRWPQFLPDGRHFLFTLWSNLPDERSRAGGVYIGSLDGGEPRRLLRDVSQAILAPGGQILFHRGGKLMAVGFDPDSREITGDARVVAPQVSFSTTNGQLGASVSDDGTLVFSNHDAETEVQLRSSRLDGSEVVDIGAPLDVIFGFDLSPKGDRYTVEILDEVGSVQIWVGDVARGTTSRLSRIENDCQGAAFSPDGREVAYIVSAGDRSALYRHDVNGARAADLILTTDQRYNLVRVNHWYEDASMLVSGFTEDFGAPAIFHVDTNTGEIRSILESRFGQTGAALSPDLRWISYVSQESGRAEVYVRRWPDLGGKWMVSRDGGSTPSWSQDGTELVFASGAAVELRAVRFEGDGDDPVIGLPRRKVALDAGMRWAVLSRSHDRLFYVVGENEGALPPLRVLLHWE